MSRDALTRLSPGVFRNMIEWMERYGIESFFSYEANVGQVRKIMLDAEDFYRLALPLGYERRQSAGVTHLRAVVAGVTITATDEIGETDWIKVAPVSPEDAGPV